MTSSIWRRGPNCGTAEKRGWWESAIVFTEEHLSSKLLWLACLFPLFRLIQIQTFRLMLHAAKCPSVDLMTGTKLPFGNNVTHSLKSEFGYPSMQNILFGQQLGNCLHLGVQCAYSFTWKINYQNTLLKLCGVFFFFFLNEDGREFLSFIVMYHELVVLVARSIY